VDEVRGEMFGDVCAGNVGCGRSLSLGLNGVAAPRVRDIELAWWEFDFMARRFLLEFGRVKLLMSASFLGTVR
jgi:hypothetical protein